MCRKVAGCRILPPPPTTTQSLLVHKNRRLFLLTLEYERVFRCKFISDTHSRTAVIKRGRQQVRSRGCCWSNMAWCWLCKHWLSKHVVIDYPQSWECVWCLKPSLYKSCLSFFFFYVITWATECTHIYTDCAHCVGYIKLDILRGRR